jgi:hypothetical protein
MPARVDAVKSGSVAGKENGDGDEKYVFLEIARAAEPMGIVLIGVSDGLYRRIGYFYMGRRELPEEEEMDGFWSPGEREWDWNDGLELRTLTII